MNMAACSPNEVTIVSVKTESQSKARLAERFIHDMYADGTEFFGSIVSLQERNAKEPA
jgi:hypothetical protein